MDDDRGRSVREEAEVADELEKVIRKTSPRRSEKRQRAAMISIRVTAEELRVVQAQAKARGLTVSRYVRDSALRPAQRSTPPMAIHRIVANTTSAETETSPTKEVMDKEPPAPSRPYLFVASSSAS
ncbi:plasmid mobilization protein [Mycobacterium sp.]|uniref:plasmid mobilization protein n=1 Tax=Mycobacterium sp. TaxID=1785 RepID=UPI003D6C567F